MFQRIRTIRNRKTFLAYIAGSITVILILGAVFVFFGFRIGFREMFNKVQRLVASDSGTASPQKIIDIPPSVFDELVRIGAAIGRGGETGLPPQDLISTAGRDYRAVNRPNIHIRAFTLRSLTPVNINPPTLYFSANEELTDTLKDYLQSEALLSYSYSTNANGLRTTTPTIESERSILMVGDSALFGSGLDDEFTIASQLQVAVGDAYRVFNAGVGGYNAYNSFQTAQEMSAEDDYDVLIYILHHNDVGFTNASIPDVEETLRRLTTLKDEFPGGIIVVFLTYMEYTERDVLHNWNAEQVARTDELREFLPGFTAQLGFGYVDWAAIAQTYMQQEGTIFAPFGLYSDHAHLSPRGSEMLAKALSNVLHDAEVTS